MPEGDSIFRAASTLHRALAGHEVVRFESVLPALTRVHEDTPLTGRTVESVAAAGKHILMRFCGDLVLRTHMRMNGSWHIYRRWRALAASPWQRPRDMRVVVATRGLRGRWLQRAGGGVPRTGRRCGDRPIFGRSVPTCSAPRSTPTRRCGAFAHAADASIADALINQRSSPAPATSSSRSCCSSAASTRSLCVADVSDDDLRARCSRPDRSICARTSWIRAATIVTYTGYRRTTRRMDPSERLYVYGRARRPCRKCGTSIRGEGARPRRPTDLLVSVVSKTEDGASVGSGMRDPGCGMRNADPTLQGPRTETEDQGLRTVDQRPRTRDEGQGTE